MIPKPLLVRVGAFIVTLLIWQALAYTDLFSVVIFSPPSVALPSLYGLLKDGTLIRPLYGMLAELSVGTLLTVLVGVLGGLALGMLDTADRVLTPYLKILNVIPKVSLITVFLLFFGYTTFTSAYLFAFFLAIFPVLISVKSAVKNVKRSFMTVSRVLGASSAQIFFFVILPATARNAASASRISLPLVMTGVLLKEFYVQISSNPSIGLLLTNYEGSFETGNLYGVIFLLAMITIFLNEVAFYIESKLVFRRS